MSTISERNYDPSKVAKRLADIRWERGISLRALAAKSGVSHNMIWLMEQGERAGRQTLVSVANALGEPLSDFLCLSAQPDRAVATQ